MSGVLVTNGARRGCGVRQPGGAYLAVPLGPGGQPVEAFLLDPPIRIDQRALGLSAVGVTLLDRGGVTHVLDIIGRQHYPTVAGFIDEARRMGVSRRISRTVDFSRITPGFSGMCARLWWQEPLEAARHRFSAQRSASSLAVSGVLGGALAHRPTVRTPATTHSDKTRANESPG